MATQPPRAMSANTPLMGVAPEQMARLSPADRAKLVKQLGKRAKGAMPNGSPMANPAPPMAPNTILS